MREIVEYQRFPYHRDPPRTTENHVERAIERAKEQIRGPREVLPDPARHATIWRTALQVRSELIPRPGHGRAR